jgi:insertion element IS1 protein InsB
MHCPACHSDHLVKNGFNPLNKQIYRCQVCGRQFVLDPAKGPISDEKKALIDRLLFERISLAGIARSVGVSECWLQHYVNKKYAEVPREIIVKKKTGGRLIIECDEVWSFVIKHDNKQWVWLAIDRDTREIVGLYMGDRSAQSAQHLWDSLPLDYRQNALIYTDFWEAYAAVFPTTRHLPVGQESGKTNHIERFNNTLRQRVSRLVRKALSFSKKLEIPYRSHLVFYSSL